MTDHSTKARELEQAMRDAGLRMTRQRAVLAEVLAGADDHPDAAELHKRVQARDAGVSLATVYRTLTELEQQGIIQRHSFEGASARFETSDPAHHDHMIDVETGSVVEFRSDRIERLQAEIAAEMGFEIVHHRLELYVRRLPKT
jgi:Fur family ferric uptake transcriptional regulator